MNHLKIFVSGVAIFFIVSLFSNCMGGFHNRKRVYRTSDLALYHLESKDISRRTLISGVFQHPQTIEPEKIKDILASLHCKLGADYIELDETVFQESELDGLAENISLALKNIDNKRALVVISKNDEFKSIVSNPSRNTFLLWVDNQGLNLVFGDIKKIIPRSVSHDPKEWTTVQPISFTITESSAHIIKNDSFEYKTVDNFFHKKWIIFDLGKGSSKTEGLSAEDKQVISTPPKNKEQEEPPGEKPEKETSDKKTETKSSEKIKE
jgi:hypothetical protein